MFSWLFGKKKGESKIVAVLDVGSGSVGGALGVLHSDGQPELLFAVREELPLRMTRSSSEMAKNAAAASGRVMDQVRRTAALFNEGTRITPKRIDHLAIFLAAPWSSGTIRTLRLNREKPFPMSAEVLRKMLNDETKVAMAHQDTGLEILERTAVGLKLNGYPVDAITQVEVKDAEITLATSLSPKAFLVLLIDAIGELQHETKRTFHSFGLPVAHILPRIIPSIDDALIIDAGAEVTEIVHIKGGVPTERATAPVGTHMLLRTLQAHGRMQKKEAETALKLAQLDGTRLSETHKTAIAGAAREWAKSVLLAAASANEEGAAPLSVYIFSDTPPQAWLVEALAREPYPKQTTPIQAVRGIAPKDFEKIVRLRGVVPDPFLCAELIFCDERFDNRQSLELASTREPLLNRTMPVAQSAILEETAPEKDVRTL